MKKIVQVLAVGILSGLALSACNKEEATVEVPEVEESTGVVNPTTEQLDAVNGSPTIAIWTAGMKLGTTLMLLEKHPTLTDKQQECLLGADADKAYFENSKREMLAVLGEDGIQQADNFYNSEVGKKVAAFSQEQMAIAAGKKIDKPLELTADEKTQMEEFMASEMMVKMRQNIATISPEKMEADLALIAEQEAVRCGLSADAQEKTNTVADFKKESAKSDTKTNAPANTDEKPKQ